MRFLRHTAGLLIVLGTGLLPATPPPKKKTVAKRPAARRYAPRLTAAQLAILAAEPDPDLAPNAGPTLVAAFSDAIERALDQVRATSEATLLEVRGVGRAQLPATVMGLLFHAAEHTQRHVGQAVTTARIVSGYSG